MLKEMGLDYNKTIVLTIPFYFSELFIFSMTNMDDLYD